MIIRFFSTAQPLAILVLCTLAAVLSLASLSYDGDTSESGFSSLLSPVVHYLSQVRALSALGGWALILSQVFILNATIQSNRLTREHTYVPALFFVTLSYSHPLIIYLNPFHFTGLFLLLSINRVLSFSRSASSPLAASFDAGLYIALASLFYFPAIFLYLLIPTGLLFFGPYGWREWVISALGLLLPYFFAFCILFWFDSADNMILHISDCFDRQPALSGFSGNRELLLLASAGLLAAASARGFLKEISSNVLRVSRSYSLIAWFFFLPLALYATIPCPSFAYFFLLAAPLSLIYSALFGRWTNPWLKELVFMVFLLIILFSYFL